MPLFVVATAARWHRGLKTTGKPPPRASKRYSFATRRCACRAVAGAGVPQAQRHLKRCAAAGAKPPRALLGCGRSATARANASRAHRTCGQDAAAGCCCREASVAPGVTSRPAHLAGPFNPLQPLPLSRGKFKQNKTRLGCDHPGQGFPAATSVLLPTSAGSLSRCIRSAEIKQAPLIPGGGMTYNGAIPREGPDSEVPRYQVYTNRRMLSRACA